MYNTMSGQQASHVSLADQRAFIQRVFAWMSGGLLLTAGTAAAVSSSFDLAVALFTGPLRLVIMFAPLAMVIFLSARIHAMKATTAITTFLVYSVVMGLSLSYIFLVYDLGSITSTFISAAAMFAGMAFYGYTTKRDLTGVGSFMMMGLFGIIITSLINVFFLESSFLQMGISVLGVIIFAGLTAWDMQRIKEWYVAEYDGAESGTKAAIIGALELYLDFVNIFLFLLRLFGNRR